MGVAIRHRKLARRVIGIGRRQISLEKALEAGAVDEVTLNLSEGVSEADLVIVATPIGALIRLAPAVVKAMKPGAILSDVASAKTRIVEELTTALGARNDIFYISTHPMAGSERRGPQAARETLFEGCTTIFTPLRGTPREQIARLRGLYEALGAKVVTMTPDDHDRSVARISHCPHLAAVCLLELASDQELLLCGRGFVDSTRIASANADLWTDICQHNAEYIHTALSEYIALLEKVQQFLKEHDSKGLRGLLAQAKEKRDRLLQLQKDFDDARND